MPTKRRLPSYEPMLAAYHRAFAVELQAMVAALPIRPGQTDSRHGVWRWRLQPVAGRASWAARAESWRWTCDPSISRWHRSTRRPHRLSGIIEYQAASIESLPFEDHSFDLMLVCPELLQPAGSGGSTTAHADA